MRRGELIRFVVVDHSADAILKGGLRKIEKQPNWLLKQPEVA